MADLRVVLADDEPLVRSGLRAFLEAVEGMTVVGEARNGLEAVEVIQSERPDLVFLDVQMPELDGFRVVEALQDELPAIVFVTAFDEYALRAFDVHAVDYLLKPFEEERFRLALARARQRIGERSRETSGDALRAALVALQARGTYRDRLLVRHDGRITVVATDDVDWIEAADNYVRLHTKGARYLVREPLRTLEEQLDPACFARIHRSAIVNLRRVTELQPLFGGEYAVILSSGERLTLSRSYRDPFRQRFGGNW